MKAWKFNPKFEVIEATDLYFIESYGKWYPVPKHWVGTLTILSSFRIKSGNSK
jgi:hypothetical protein